MMEESSKAGKKRQIPWVPFCFKRSYEINSTGRTESWKQEGSRKNYTWQSGLPAEAERICV